MLTKLIKLLTLNLYNYSFSLRNRKNMEFYLVLFSHMISDNFLIISFISLLKKKINLILVCECVCVHVHAYVRVCLCLCVLVVGGCMLW